MLEYSTMFKVNVTWAPWSARYWPLVLAMGAWWVAMACSDGGTPTVPSTPADVPQTAVASTPEQRATPPPERPDTIFIEVGNTAGVDFAHYRPTAPFLLMPFGAGVVILDYDGDGLQDIFVPMTYDDERQANANNALYRNNGDGTFSDLAGEAGVVDPRGKGIGGCAADYDNDGDQDLFLTNYGSSKLFRNSGDGAFEDVTEDARVGDPDNTFRSMGCAWGDYDRDGYLDMVVVRHMSEAELSPMGGAPAGSPLRSLALYHNEGDGGFTNVTSLLGDDSEPAPMQEEGDFAGNVWGAGFQPGWLDFNNDGYTDLYVVNDFGADAQPNVLWRNDGRAEDGSWTFTDISTESRTDVGIFGMGLAVGDYNLDGHLDMFMSNIGRPVLLSNDGDGLTFTDTTRDAGIDIGFIEDLELVTWGNVFFDYDNDGDEDLYVSAGYLDFFPDANPKAQPNVLMRNDGDGTFTDVSEASGADDAGYGRGAVYMDFDNDGCLDLYVANIGKGPAEPQRARLFRNRCDWGNGWLVVNTVGTISNRDGVGARIMVEAGGKTQIREVSAGGSNKSQNMLPVHFGLGKADMVDTIEVRWPSGTVQTLEGVAPDQTITIVEAP
ncbi:MAG: CRTAC1 family protein [Dehalococcoidia bacterium]|nr:CRTAC1 family protein [Dehalococcoidia bacterium]